MRGTLVLSACLWLAVACAPRPRADVAATARPTAQPTATAGIGAHDAWAACQKWVAGELKAPSTAAFASYGESRVQATGTTAVLYRVGSYVDAENGFGAHIRTHYVCSIQWTGTEWNYLSLDMS